MSANKIMNIWKKLTRPRGAVILFVIQAAEQALKVVKLSSAYGIKKDFIAVDAQELPAGADDKILVEKLVTALRKLGYSQERVILSLARSQATCRFVKIPSTSAAEIEKIAAFQASKYLPYAANELISGYQVVNVDKAGFAFVNLVIVHKDAVERYLNILAAAGVADIQITLSSFGLSGLYSHISARDPRPTMLVDIDDAQVELAIVAQGRMLFSRSFKLTGSANREQQLTDEINRTNTAYLKEAQGRLPEQVVILSARQEPSQPTEFIQKEVAIPSRSLNYCLKISCSRNFSEAAANLRYSLAGLVGLGLEELPDSLNLLPANLKEKGKAYSRRKKQLRNLVFVLVTLLIWGLGIAKSMQNKKVYLERLQAEILKLSAEARPFEELERRSELLLGRAKLSESVLEILRELYRIIPQQMVLSGLGYEEDKSVTLRGSTPELNAVFGLVQQIEGSAVFKEFTVKVKYATKKSTPAGDTVDFQIDCLKRGR
jgi:Tfp pilus assembly PilM family ATPase